VLVLVFGLIGGIVIAAMGTDHSVCSTSFSLSGSSCYTETTHPYVGFGIGAAISSAVTALMMNLVALWAQAYVASRRFDVEAMAM
jgi:hypothetical protein